jgi:nickel transport protein
MKRPFIFSPLIVAATMAAITNMMLPQTLAAHGVEVSLETNTGGFQSEAVRFMYSTGEAMSFAIIRMYAPSKPDVEVVQSITDRNGIFSFVPDEEGDWKITAEDGMGHKGLITVAVVDKASDEKPSGGENAVKTKQPLLSRIMLGLSLILNIFAVYYFVLKNRSMKKETAYAH